MIKEQGILQSREYIGQKRRLKSKRRQFFSILYLCCLIVGVFAFPLEVIATGEVFTSSDGSAPLEAASSDQSPPELAQKEENPSEVSKGYILLDPGHGGEESPGSAYGGVLERDVTSALSLLIRDELAARGYTVEMTREVDKAVPIEKRTEIANQSGADLLLSIHLNAHEDASVFGAEGLRVL